MTSFKGIESAAISNNQAWKAMVTIYYVGESLYSNGQIWKVVMTITVSEMTSAKLGASIVTVTGLYHLCESIDNDKMWIIAIAFPIDGNKHSVLCRSDSNSWINLSINESAQVITRCSREAYVRTFNERQTCVAVTKCHNDSQQYSRSINMFFWFWTACWNIHLMPTNQLGFDNFRRIRKAFIMWDPIEVFPAL